MFLKFNKNFTWNNVDILKYKEEGTHFKDVSRQILYPGNSELQGELRYFEISAGGHTTFERHEHIHVVVIIRGTGKLL